MSVSPAVRPTKRSLLPSGPWRLPLVVCALALVALVAGAAGGWFATEPDWRPALIGLAAIGLLVGTVRGLALEPRAVPEADPDIRRVVDRDRLLFTDLIGSAPEEAFDFLRAHDHGWSFNRNVVFALRNFMHEWSEVENRFDDGELDRMRLDLVEKISRYLGALNVYTYPTDNVTGRFVIPRWLYRDSRTYTSRVEEMNERAADVVAVWDALVRRGGEKYPASARSGRRPERRVATGSEA